MTEKRVAILGSTGSIGRQALEVIDRLPGYSVVGLVAGSNEKLWREQIEKHSPNWAVLVNGSGAGSRLGQTALAYGQESLLHYAANHGADIVVSAISGVAGLLPTWLAITSGVSVALANKESLVAAGHLVMQAVRESKLQLLPVDSEHSALWQCLQACRPEQVKRLILTASGGPFRELAQEKLPYVTAEQALAHPNWSMGAKISVDSATLMNKGLEVIEAHWLFGVDYEHIDVYVHPQSIVHSFVETIDGSLLAQLSLPDMRLPIQLALTHPERVDLDWPRLQLSQMGMLTFEEPRIDAFPCLKLAIAAGEQGGSYPLALNAANEVAVAAFLRGDISFGGIPRLVSLSLEHAWGELPATIEEVLEIDRRAREVATKYIPKAGDF